MAFKLKDTSLYKKSSRKNSCAFKSILGSLVRIFPKGSLGNKTSGKGGKESNADRVLSGKKTNNTA